VFPYILFVILACMVVLGKMLPRCRGEAENRLVFGGMTLSVLCFILVSFSELNNRFGNLDRTPVVEAILKQKKVHYVSENVNR